MGRWQLVGDEQAMELLNQANAWAMILDEDGMVIWEENLPEELPHHYSSMDIAMFSRWYLNDYPVNIWNRQDSLLVVGFPQGEIANYYISMKAQYVASMAFEFFAAICINVLLMLYLFVRNVRRVEKAIKPLLNGIRHLSEGKPIHLEEDGELAEINSGLNKAGTYLVKKDNTRAEWIRGISHDIRTPLSMIMGDRTLFSRMLYNLTQNSIVHNPDGCKIQVLVGSNDKECIFSVIDDGKGMDASQLNTFNDGQAIFSTQNLAEGIEHGLGLKIVRQIVKAHKGSVLFIDTLPQGLTAKVYILTET